MFVIALWITFSERQRPQFNITEFSANTPTHTLSSRSGPGTGHWSQLAPEEWRTVWCQMLCVCLCMFAERILYTAFRLEAFQFFFLVPKKFFLLNRLVFGAPAFRPHWGSVVTLQHAASAACPSRSNMSSFGFFLFSFFLFYIKSHFFLKYKTEIFYKDRFSSTASKLTLQHPSQSWPGVSCTHSFLFFSLDLFQSL